MQSRWWPMDGALIVFVVLNVLAASSGAVFQPGDWYDGLAKPSWRPPAWLFGPAWTVLYIMIAISGWMAWHAAGPGEAWLAMTVYGIQTVLNAAWSGIFFGMRRMKLALFEMAFLWLSILATIIVFWPISQTAALLLVPYLAWVSFAFMLNRAMIRLNPELATA
ncbi:MAG: TspO/MBR family protein [Pseudomonadota bacterium]